METCPYTARNEIGGLEGRGAMVGRFTAKRGAPAEFIPVEEPSPTLEGVAWTVFPDPASEPVLQAPDVNLLQSDKLLDAKVRLHRRLIEEVNLQALERLPEDQIRAHIQQLVSQYILVERLALNAQELNDFVSEILDEMMGLGPIEPLLKDDSISDILINGHEKRLRRARRRARAVRRSASRTTHHLLRIVNKIVAAVGPAGRRIPADVRRPPARRQPRQRRDPPDRRRRPAGLDPQILQEAVQPRPAGRSRRDAARRWPSSWRRRQGARHHDHLRRHRLGQDHPAQRAVGLHLGRRSA